MVHSSVNWSQVEVMLLHWEIEKMDHMFQKPLSQSLKDQDESATIGGKIIRVDIGVYRLSTICLYSMLDPYIYGGYCIIKLLIRVQL